MIYGYARVSIAAAIGPRPMAEIGSPWKAEPEPLLAGWQSIDARDLRCHAVARRERTSPCYRTPPVRYASRVAGLRAFVAVNGSGREASTVPRTRGGRSDLVENRAAGWGRRHAPTGRTQRGRLAYSGAALRIRRIGWMLIVDAQIHLWQKGTPSPQHQQEPYSAEQAIAAMDRGRVDRALIHPVLWIRTSNELAADGGEQIPRPLRSWGGSISTTRKGGSSSHTGRSARGCSAYASISTSGTSGNG